MPFVPPHFKDIGKKAKDVLSKKYDFENELKTVNKADGGVKIEAGSSFVKGLDTYAKATYNCGCYGLDLEGEIHTAAPDSATSAKVTLNKLAPGAKVAITTTAASSVKVEADYTQDMFASKALFNQGAKGTSLGLAACVGMDGYTFGATSDLDLSGGSVALKGLDFGAEARVGKTHGALKTVKNQSAVQLSVWNAVSSDLAVGTSVNYTLKDSSSAISFGADYALDKATSVKAKADQTGAVAFVVEHKLADPKVKIAASTQMDAFALGAPAKKYGLSFVFGDY